MKITSLILTSLALALASVAVADDFQQRRSTYALDGIYAIVDSFVRDSLQPKTIDQLMTEFGLDGLDDFNSEFLDRWRDWAWSYTGGYAVSVVLGTLLLVGVPIAGLIVCCCRCCCASKKSNESSHCARLVCSLVLLFLLVNMLAAVACVFSATFLLREESKPGQGLLEDLQLSVGRLERFINDTSVEIEDVVLGKINVTSYELVALIEGIPADSFVYVAQQTGSYEPAARLDQFTDDLPRLSDDTAVMLHSRAALEALDVQLADGLEGPRASLETLLARCNSAARQQCDIALALVSNLRVLANHSLMDNVFRASLAVNSTLSVRDDLRTGLDGYYSIEEEIADQLDAPTAAATEKLREMVDDVERNVRDFTDELEKYNVSSWADFSNDLSPDVDLYGGFVFYGMLAFNLPALLVVVALLVGLLVGTAAPRPGRKSSACCTSACGSRFLTAGVAIFFVYSFFVLLIVVVFCPSGAAVDNNVCRHAEQLDASASRLESMVLQAVAAVDFGLNGSLTESLRRCRDDRALYEALDLEHNGVNITELLDPDRYGLSDQIENIRNITIVVSISVEFFPAESSALLKDLSAEMDDVDYGSFRQQLATDILSENFSEVVREVEDAVVEVRKTDPNLADAIEKENGNLAYAHGKFVPEMESLRTGLRPSVNSSQRIMQRAELSATVDELLLSQELINDKSSELSNEYVHLKSENISSMVYSSSKRLELFIRQDVARCRPLQLVFYQPIYAACHPLLANFNVLWFAYGWFIVAALFAVGFSLRLATDFRQPSETLTNQIDPEPDYSDSEGDVRKHAWQQ